MFGSVPGPCCAYLRLADSSRLTPDAHSATTKLSKLNFLIGSLSMLYGANGAPMVFGAVSSLDSVLDMIVEVVLAETGAAATCESVEDSLWKAREREARGHEL